MTHKEMILKQYFGYETFRPAQADIIDAILAGQDNLAIMPTSAGKSLCFQVPALLLPGVTLVISPLISLMHDQVTALKEMGIPAILMNSTMTTPEYKQAITYLYQGKVKLLYVAPERLENAYFVNMMKQLTISLIAVDEAHCISQWGQDFRPSYQKIFDFVQHLATRPTIAAFTATATPRVREDIQHYLQLEKPFITVTNFDRPNLFFGLEEPSDKFRRLIQLLKSHEPTIVFCNTRKEVETVCQKLQERGIKADWYHAGLSNERRSQVQEAFIFDQIDVIVATNAFGMGIDKSNVRKVIHYNMPKDLESYYQEAGRAGRDGEAAECWLLYGSKDIITNKFLIKKGEDPVGMTKLQDMIDYCRTIGCLRSFVLRYFGQRNLPQACENCTNCLQKMELVDITQQAQMILSCVIRMKESYGITKVIEVLRGSQRAEMQALQFNQLSTYGIMKQYSEQKLRNFIGALVADRYVEVSGEEYPILKVSNKGKQVLKERKKIQMKQSVATILLQPDQIVQHPVDRNAPFDSILFDKLRSLRFELSTKNQIPPFLVFSDMTLKEFCRHLPTTEDAFLQISGVGSKKLATYGEAFMTIIRNHLAHEE